MEQAFQFCMRNMIQLMLCFGSPDFLQKKSREVLEKGDLAEKLENSYDE